MLWLMSLAARMFGDVSLEIPVADAKPARNFKGIYDVFDEEDWEETESLATRKESVRRRRASFRLVRGRGKWEIKEQEEMDD